ncbi:sulfite reductase subunit alpha [Uliginosibacterium sp. TH139]|uniref:sulfite reductase subunit alpha n=1 Tax=Uliginosibacterium sp. TH139 TaxID=2067453 RepID=UPI000C7C2EFF|nr:sulfite reductase subunit alpha [Uliginosibacterium sp. TH139]PLK48979.1 oxidoreductase [Uliginosibacterium sp. TH139]
MMDNLSPEIWRLQAAVGLILAYALMCWRMYRKAALAGLPAPGPQPAAAPAAARGKPVWIIHASQTGQAEALARQAARALEKEGVAVIQRRIDQPWLEEVSAARHVLFVVSTYGEGNPPDHAISFARTRLAAGPCAALRGLSYGVLALGDRSYPQFCAFGRQLDQWLQQSGASAYFPRIDADRLDALSLKHWQQALQGLGVHTPLLTPPLDAGYTEWRFIRRRCLNSGSPGAPLFKLELQPQAGLPPHWQAGDLIDLIPPGGDGRPRSYSIANLPEDGHLELIVRSVSRADGLPGLASGWLNETAWANDRVSLRIRRNPGFNLECGADTPLILIGAGSGLAGLRSHLQARARAIADSGQPAPERSAWLIFGERSERHDRPCHSELEAWRRSRVLSRLDLTFSHDDPIRAYVQHALLEEAQAFRQWITAGAQILICGSAQGMAQGVEQAMREILGDEGLEQLRAAGRIRRDVY